MVWHNGTRCGIKSKRTVFSSMFQPDHGYTFDNHVLRLLILANNQEIFIFGEKNFNI